jgi:hypothetical protein
MVLAQGLGVSDIDTEAVNSLKVLDPKRPIREADIRLFLRPASKPEKPKGNSQDRDWCTYLEIGPKIEFYASRLRPLSHNEIGNGTDQCEISG